MNNETSAERMARKKRESELRIKHRIKEQEWIDLFNHVYGIMMILAKWMLGYKPNLKKEK